MSRSNTMIILVPTDFSPTSARGMAYARDLAKRLNARIAVIHVIDHHPAQMRFGASHSVFEDEIVISARDALETAIDCADVRDLLYKACVEVDPSPEDAIARFATAVGADMIVMGTHGRTGVPRFFLGSVAEEVLKSARCPVLTIGPTRELHHAA